MRAVVEIMCETCQGSGARRAPGYSDREPTLVDCLDCNGRGNVHGSVSLMELLALLDNVREEQRQSNPSSPEGK